MRAKRRRLQHQQNEPPFFTFHYPFGDVRLTDSSRFECETLETLLTTRWARDSSDEIFAIKRACRASETGNEKVWLSVSWKVDYCSFRRILIHKKYQSQLKSLNIFSYKNFNIIFSPPNKFNGIHNLKNNTFIEVVLAGRDLAREHMHAIE